jgi:hypothetical protein
MAAIIGYFIVRISSKEQSVTNEEIELTAQLAMK